ncbi:bifunctional GNAT family N-acetyltransferase/hotdog fold thioesterase [Thalassotalea nanhaiensis]|uniref:Bifunctional GNAT family N-acetyltransferase/hotdog fold thioesterase n=1 Tax=Thalassotalea nanhaiensis TaxID=3065648 RepID=A0ABY9TL99_9GAMM|nr:bifunctional GNAT family N-acetyltransferase/hotdog fold thioesterase [Colwelliaceae bacterium SQ345]
MSEYIFTVKQPTSEDDYQGYHQLRFQQLRQPWGQPKGSEVDELENQSVHRMVVDQCGNVVAVGRFHKTSCFVAQIRFMAVSDKYQGQGLGKMILNALEHEAAVQGVKTIELNAREVALNFYKACDYQLHDEAHTLYSEVKHFAMSKTLQPINNQFTPWLAELEGVWHSTIPVSKHMLIHPASLVNKQFTVCANREANINLHNTMFAGSIYTLATLTGWGWVHLLVKQQQLQGDIVLADADIRYKQPLHGQPLAKVQQEFTSGSVEVLGKGRRARIQVKVDVCDGDTVVATFNGKYVVLPPAKPVQQGKES